MNMLLVACGDTALLVDAGVMFPEPELFGVDLVIPDLSRARRRIAAASRRSSSPTATKITSAPWRT